MDISWFEIFIVIAVLWIERRLWKIQDAVQQGGRHESR